MRKILAVLVLVGASPAFAQISPNSWSEPSGPDFTVGAGGGLVATGADTLILLAGGNSPAIARFTLSTQTWTRMADAPLAPNSGNGIAYMAGTNYCYVTAGGGGTASFYRFDSATGAAGTWTKMADLPAVLGYISSPAITTAQGKVYAFSGGSVLYQFTPNAGTGTWAARAAVPAGIQTGVGLVCPDPAGDLIYATTGTYATTSPFFRYSISGNSWTAMPNVPGRTGYNCPLGVKSAGTLIVSTDYYTSGKIYEFDVAASSWTEMADDLNITGTLGYGAAIARPAGSDSIYFARGSTNHVFRYSVSQKVFLRNLPANPSSTTVLIGAGDGNHLYAVNGYGAATALSAYSISARTWTPTGGALPEAPQAGIAACFDGQDAIYTAINQNLYRYSISGDAWTSLKIPYEDFYDMNTGELLVPNAPDYYWFGSRCPMVVAGPYVFLVPVDPFSGAPPPHSYVMRYAITDVTASDGTVTQAADSWTVVTETPAGFGEGSSLVYPGTGDAIYGLAGGGNTFAFSYSVSGDQWTQLTGCPTAVNTTGRSLFSRGTNSILVLTGSPASPFWSYAIGTGTWSRLLDPPGSLGGGSQIATPGGSLAAHPEGGEFSFYVVPDGGYHDMWIYYAKLDAPADPAAMAQRKASDDSPLVQGGVVRLNQVKLQVTATQPQGAQVRAEVELVPFSASFTGSGPAVTGVGPVPSGSVVTVTVGGLAPGGYKWRARVINALDASSPWVEYGTASADFSVMPNNAPILVSASQARSEGGLAIPAGGSTIGEGVLLETNATDADGDDIYVDIEVQPITVAFTGVPTISMPFQSSGSAASALLALPVGEYHWQVRAGDAFGGITAWTPYGTNAENQADFRVQASGSVNSHGDFCSVSGTDPGPGLLLAAAAVLVALGIARR